MQRAKQAIPDHGVETVVGSRLQVMLRVKGACADVTDENPPGPAFREWLHTRVAESAEKHIQDEVNMDRSP